MNTKYTAKGKKTLSYYHFLCIALLIMCAIISTTVIIICFIGQNITKFYTVFIICVVIVLLMVITVTIILLSQYKRTIELNNSFKNLSNIIKNIKNKDNNIIKTQNETELNIYKSVENILEELNKNYERLLSTKQQLEEKLKNREHLEIVHHEFIANASHEIKTPLGLLMLYAEGLKNNIDNIDKDYYCDVIIEVIENLDKKVKRLMSVSLVESGLTLMKMESFDYSELFRCINDRFGIMLLEFDAHIEYDKDIYVYGDIYYLGEVIKNFITNAVAYTDKGKIIQIKLKKTEKYAELSVYNEGVNIELECMSNIWNSFYKGEKGCHCEDSENHMGMGLYMVRLVMEQHDGIYGVDNLSDGVRFYTRLALI